MHLEADEGPGFKAGFRAPFRGARLVFGEHAALVRIWVWPIAIVAAAHIAVLVSSALLHDDLLALVWPHAEGAWAVVRWIVRVLVLIALVVLGLSVVHSSATVVAAPFNDLLAERVDLALEGRAPPRFRFGRLVRQVGRSFVLTASRLLAYAVVMAAAFVASFALPVVGQVLYVPFGWVTSALYLTFDATDWPLARRGLAFGDRLRYLRRHIRPALGMGLALWLVMGLPVVGLVFMPAAVAGGVLLVREIGQAPRGRSP